MRGIRTDRRHGERGSVSVFTVVFAVAVIALVGLLVDGGGMLSARERANDIAEQAARAAVTDLNVADLRKGTVAVAGGACAYAHNTVTAYEKSFNSVTSLQNVTCRPGTNTRSVTVTVTLSVAPVIPAPGFTRENITATQTATAICGNADRQEAC